MHQPITLDTIGALLDNRYTLTAHCHGCGHHQRLDLANLCDRLGRDYAAVRQRWPLTCSECGGREAGVLVAPDR